MLKVPYGQDPYSVIGKYIRDHIAAIEDMIAVIEIDGITTNQLFMVDMNEENYFIWNNDWYEGEKDVALVDFFPVSEAINPSAQLEQSNVSELWRKRADYYSDLCMRLIAEMGKGVKINSVKISESGIEFIKEQPPAQPERTEERTETYACDLISRRAAI